MAKLSDLIENFDSMSDADKLAAAANLEIPDAPDLTQYVKKSVFDKTASDLAAAKKTIADKLTAEEAAAAAKAQEDADKDERMKELVRKVEIADNEKELLKQGYSAALAAEVAEAMADGDKARVFAGQAKHQEEREKAIRAELMRGQAKPEGGGEAKEEDDLIARAKALGKASAEKRKTSEDILGKYTKR